MVCQSVSGSVRPIKSYLCYMVASVIAVRYDRSSLFKRGNGEIPDCSLFLRTVVDCYKYNFRRARASHVS